jgi:hypothetical protein
VGSGRGELRGRCSLALTRTPLRALAYASVLADSAHNQDACLCTSMFLVKNNFIQSMSGEMSEQNKPLPVEKELYHA